MTSKFSVSDVPWHWRLGADGRWLTGPKVALDAVASIVDAKEKNMAMPDNEIRVIAQKLRKNLSSDDLYRLVNMLMSDEGASDQPDQPDLLALKDRNDAHAFDHLPPPQRLAAREKIAAAQGKQLAEAGKRWPQAQRLGLI